MTSIAKGFFLRRDQNMAKASQQFPKPCGHPNELQGYLKSLEAFASNMAVQYADRPNAGHSRGRNNGI